MLNVTLFWQVFFTTFCFIAILALVAFMVTTFVWHKMRKPKMQCPCDSCKGGFHAGGECVHPMCCKRLEQWVEEVGKGSNTTWK